MVWGGERGCARPHCVIEVYMCVRCFEAEAGPGGDDSAFHGMFVWGNLEA